MNASIPAQTRIWIGRYDKRALLQIGSDVRLDFPERIILDKKIPAGSDNAAVTTIIMGHLAIQVVSVRIGLANEIPDHRSFTSMPGNWIELLISIWSPDGVVAWPPPLSFTDSAKSIGDFVRRWNP